MIVTFLLPPHQLPHHPTGNFALPSSPTRGAGEEARAVFLLTLDLHADRVDGQVQHLPMAGSQLFRRDLIDVRHGVAVMQHQHAQAGAGHHGGETTGTERLNQVPMTAA